MPKSTYVVYGTEAFSETGLFGRLEVVESACETILNDSRKQHVDTAQKGDRSVVLQESVVAFLKEQDHRTSAPRLRSSATMKDGIEELLKDFKYRCSTRFQKLRCNSILAWGPDVFKLLESRSNLAQTDVRGVIGIVSDKTCSWIVTLARGSNDDVYSCP
ncbi:unnamed protein product [Parnassius apollo]|uniref:(apollo) hypothetical protein n=1 Tax=Parnassius apollo TaxID=110799 RepID=A0A8S3X4B7_PARAO|nr:unnamed protein product [Parnassius apollo]